MLGQQWYGATWKWDDEHVDHAFAADCRFIGEMDCRWFATYVRHSNNRRTQLLGRQCRRPTWSWKYDERARPDARTGIRQYYRGGRWLRIYLFRRYRRCLALCWKQSLWAAWFGQCNATNVTASCSWCYECCGGFVRNLRHGGRAYLCIAGGRHFVLLWSQQPGATWIGRRDGSTKSGEGQFATGCRGCGGVSVYMRPSRQWSCALLGSQRFFSTRHGQIELHCLVPHCRRLSLKNHTSAQGESVRRLFLDTDGETKA